MSPTLLALLQRIDRSCRRDLGKPDCMGARYPRDYRRPAEQVRRSPWILPMYL